MSDLDVANDASDILDQDDRERILVDVPEWDCSIYLQEMSGKERDDFESRMIDARRTNTTVKDEEGQTVDINMQNTRARLVARCAVNEDGKRLFTADQVSELGDKSASALDRLYEKAQELNGMNEEDIEELEGNLGQTQQNGTG